MQFPRCRGNTRHGALPVRWWFPAGVVVFSQGKSKVDSPQLTVKPFLIVTVNGKLWIVNCLLEFWMMNRNRAKAGLPPADKKGPRGPRYACFLLVRGIVLLGVIGREPNRINLGRSRSRLNASIARVPCLWLAAPLSRLACILLRRAQSYFGTL